MRQFSKKLPLNEMASTIYGTIDHQEWMQRECERLNREYRETVFFIKTTANTGCIMTTLREKPAGELIAEGWHIK